MESPTGESKKPMTFRHIGSISPLIALGYVVAAFIINAGYIKVLGLWSSTLFGVQDLFQVSVFIFILFWVPVIIATWLWIFVVLSFGDIISKLNIIRYQNIMYFLLTASGLYFIGLWLKSEFPEYTGGLFVAMAILVIFAGSIIGLGSARFRGIHLYVARMLSGLSIVAGLFLMGTGWAEYDRLSNDKVVSLIYDNKSCSIVTLMRFVSSGVIVYNKYSGEFQFWKSESIRSIVPGVACL